MQGQGYAFSRTPAVVRALQQWEVSVWDRLLSEEPLGEVIPVRRVGRPRKEGR